MEGWYTKTETRKEGSTAGTFDTYFFSPEGKRFRSKAEIARHFNLDAAPPKSARTQEREREKAERAAARDAKQKSKLAELEAKQATTAQ